jgi:hypothetical protein
MSKHCLCRRFVVMEEATSKFEVAIGDGAVWVSPTDEFGGGGRVKGGAPNNGMSCRSVRWAWSSVDHIV